MTRRGSSSVDDGLAEPRDGDTADTALVVVAGTTATGEIEGISAAGGDPAAAVHTPVADTEILTRGRVRSAATLPVGPNGCPTPAVLSRAVVETLGLETLVVDAGLAASPATQTRRVADRSGADIREAVAVPDAAGTYDRARAVGRSLSADRVVIGETVPGGTTTAMAVLRALGRPTAVSSSLPDNPTALKNTVVADALAASGIAPGDLAGRPLAAVRAVGDPVLPAVAGVVRGATATDTTVVLGGGTQMAAVAALLRGLGVETPLRAATTAYVAADETADLARLGTALSLAWTVTDPALAELGDHPVAAGYAAGAGKEGVGAGGALAVADEAGALAAVRSRVERVYERLSESSSS
ncbi:nicotinate-nucleotide--dimethylbenzimidazole phosphoribosyltransferase [Halobaculum sp. MBLA0143]|uniref:nicotinate-nucleotide--dimethylbenzimidazole phosphoribosyltransferase n=1 Tax=Halobaculum sp. MBLA0143 TaxID=3079933 RepID=UPI003526902A